ncbi:ring-H2 protein [Medicago truncatula]|uniref:Ring-H2 protein n=1 Tax=Medicago truncatula TaxID=3880 RepID=A0A072TY98_MEDTR|nr:ring-H2 protein [Medicago truncatula]
MMIFPPSSSSSGNNNFHLEIGNFSNHRKATATDKNNVSGETNRRRTYVNFSGEKDDAAVLAVEVEAPVVSQASLVGDGNWLKDYADSLSRVTLFRDSGIFFIGSSRRNDVVAGVGDFDVEANTNGFGGKD